MGRLHLKSVSRRITEELAGTDKDSQVRWAAKTTLLIADLLKRVDKLERLSR